MIGLQPPIAELKCLQTLCSPRLMKPCNDPLDSFAEREPAVVCVGLHGPEPATEISCLRAKPNGEMRQ